MGLFHGHWDDDSHQVDPNKLTLESFTYRLTVKSDEFRTWMNGHYPDAGEMSPEEWFTAFNNWINAGNSR